MKIQLTEEIQKVISGLTDHEVRFSVEVPENEEHGDYSTNAALVLSKILKNNPREIAETMKGKLEDTLSDLECIKSIEIAGPGFINFFVQKEYLCDHVNTIIEQGNSFGQSQYLSGKRVITEFTDPNPFKEFHIGHLYSNSVGEAISRLIESQDADVRRVNYQGDIGLHVAKSLWGIDKQLTDSNIQFEDLEKKQLEDKAKFLGEAYATGAQAYEENEKAKQEIIELNKKIFAKDPELMPLYEKGKEWSLAYFEKIYERLGTKFEAYYFESNVGEEGKRLVEEYTEKGVFERSEGAVIFKGKKYGLHNRVFINSLGLPTYEAKELGLAPAKYDDYPYDTSIIITGNEINAYFQVLLKALELIRPDLAEKTVHIGHGMVRLPEGKMSSRTGNVITGQWLLDEAKRRAQLKIDETVKERSEEIDKEMVSEKVAVGAVKYALLKQSIGKDIEFSFDESISFEGNAGPYLQYTHVRTQSVLNKVKNQNSEVKNGEDLSLKINNLTSEEISVMRHLTHYPEVIEKAAANYSPHYVCTYLYDLAQKFNLFYQKHKVIGSEEQEFRLRLVEAVGITFNNGLNILGIPVVEKM